MRRVDDVDGEAYHGRREWRGLPLSQATDQHSSRQSRDMLDVGGDMDEDGI